MISAKSGATKNIRILRRFGSTVISAQSDITKTKSFTENWIKCDSAQNVARSLKDLQEIKV